MNEIIELVRVINPNETEVLYAKIRHPVHDEIWTTVRKLDCHNTEAVKIRQEATKYDGR